MNVADAVGQASTRPGVILTEHRHTRERGSVHTNPTEKERIQSRLNTFVGWTGAVLSLQLAVAGFIYTGALDTVRCVFCGLKVFNWRSDLKPLEIHRHFSPNCSFLKQWFSGDKTTGGIQLKQNGHANYGYDATKAKMQSYVEFVKRVSSFWGWPHKNEIQSAKNMAMAGFFYLGSSDRAKCFYCGLVLRDWDSDDEPVTCHKQWSPNCAYIKHISDGEHARKENFIDLSKYFVQQPTPSSTLPPARPSDIESDSDAEATSAVSSSDPRVMKSVPSPDQRWRHSPAVQALLDWGYPLDRIQEGMRRHRRNTGRDVTNASELMCAVEEIE